MKSFFKKVVSGLYLAGIDDGLQLQCGEKACADDALRDGEGVGDVGWGHAGQGVGLHDIVRVGDANRSCVWRTEEELFISKTQFELKLVRTALNQQNQ